VEGAPTIVPDSVRVSTIAADLAEVRWETIEPTTGVVTATVDGATQTYIDSYNLNAVAEGENEPGYEGIDEGPVETSDDYADRPVVSTRHEVLVTGLDGGEQYELTITSADLAGGRPEDHDNSPQPEGSNATSTAVPLVSTDAVYGAQPFDMAQLTEAPTDPVAEFDPITGVGDGTYGLSTQMYAGQADGNGFLGAFMFRVPDTLDTSRILGAAVEMTSAQDITSHYFDDTRLFVDLLPEEGYEPIQEGGSTYSSVHSAPPEARLNAQTGYRRGGGKTYTFAFRCDQLDVLRETLEGAPTAEGDQLASFRYDALVDPEVAESLFAMEFGFNRRSHGADLRPQLVLFLEGEDQGVAEQPRACDPNTPAPVIRDVGVQPGVPDEAAAEGDPGSVVVSWRTDVPSDSTVLFRPAGSDEPFTQVGSDALTTAHAIEVFGLELDVDYVFGVRSATCNGLVTTDDNEGAGYSFGPVAGEDPGGGDDVSATATGDSHELGAFDFEDGAQGWVVQEGDPNVVGATNTWELEEPGHNSVQDFKVRPYVDSSATSLTSPELTSVGGTVTVTWFNDRATEPDFDPLEIQWSDEPDAGFVVVEQFPGPDSSIVGYAEESVTFDVPAGPLYVRFNFVPDSNTTTLVGVSVDDVLVTQVEGEIAPPPPGPVDGKLSIEPDPVVGPHPAPSAEESIDLDGVPTRAIPTEADKAAGTCRCGEVAPATGPGGPGGTGGGSVPPTPQRVRGDGPDSACDPEFVPDPGLEDILGNIHERSIRCIAWYVITFGTGDADGDGRPEYSPQANVTREQMASFIFRLAVEAGLPIPANPPDRFEDDEASVHEAAINAAAALGLIAGKGDLDGDGLEEFDPAGLVTRGQMAAFIARVHQTVRGSLPAPTQDHFEDDDGSTFAASIAALAELRVITGVGDRDGDGRAEFAPDEFVSRAQMATFIANELGVLVATGDAEPGGSEVYVDQTSVPRGGTVEGDIETNKLVSSLTASGCGLTGAAVPVGSDNAFTVTIPASQPPGPCELSLRAVTSRPGETATQTVVYVVDLTVT
jgi:hypothetical protein